MSTRAVLLVGTAAVLAGCGSSVAVRESADRPATLPAGAVSYLTSTERHLTPAFLVRETGAPALRARLGAWGFVAAEQRYFQGESRRLQLVDSRTLRFRRPAGAVAFVGFLRSHLSPYLGSFPTLRRFAAQGRPGFLATGQECQCHLANPTYLAAVALGGTVTWLEINGPGATRRTLTALMARAP